MNVRIDVVAKAYLEHVFGVAISDFDWLSLEMDDEGRELVEACRAAARTVIAASDHVTETLH